MRTFSAQTTGVDTRAQVAYMANQRQIQNNLAKSGGSITVPQFNIGGLSTGPNANDAISGMAQHQLQSDAQSKYNSCVDQPASSCAGVGGSRTRRSRHSRHRHRRGRVSRKNQLKNQKKKNKV